MTSVSLPWYQQDREGSAERQPNSEGGEETRERGRESKKKERRGRGRGEERRGTGSILRPYSTQSVTEYFL